MRVLFWVTDIRRVLRECWTGDGETGTEGSERGGAQSVRVTDRLKGDVCNPPKTVSRKHERQVRIL